MKAQRQFDPAATECPFFATGTCKMNAKCKYLHSGMGAGEALAIAADIPCSHQKTSKCKCTYAKCMYKKE